MNLVEFESGKMLVLKLYVYKFVRSQIQLSKILIEDILKMWLQWNISQ